MNVKRRIFEGTVYYVYEPQGSLRSLPILMIHGHGGDHRGLEVLAQRLSTTVVIPDLPGFGESTALSAGHTIADYVEHLAMLMSSIGYTEYAVLGHSLGSAIALSLAASEPCIKKLVLVNPIPEFNRMLWRAMRVINGIGSMMAPRMADALVNARLYNLSTFLVHSRKRISRTYLVEYMQRQNSAQYSFSTWSESGRSIFLFDHVAIAQKLHIPAFVVHAAQDSLTTLGAIESFVAAMGAQLLVVEKAGHFLPFEKSEALYGPVQKFISEA